MLVYKISSWYKSEKCQSSCNFKRAFVCFDQKSTYQFLENCDIGSRLVREWTITALLPLRCSCTIALNFLQQASKARSTPHPVYKFCQKQSQTPKIFLSQTLYQEIIIFPYLPILLSLNNLQILILFAKKNVIKTNKSIASLRSYQSSRQ